MTPDNYPDIIYKYRSWNNDFHKNILLNNEVFMSPPNDFNDPFDCRIPKNHYLIDTPEKIDQFINDGIEKHREWLIASGKNIDFEKKQLKERLQDIETYQKEHEDLEYAEMDKHYGILSLSARWNSILMWSHYGDFHKGFCIGFNELKMRNCGLFGKGGPVTYTEEFPEINPMEQEHTMLKSFKQTHNKAKDWEYEEEYRLTNLFFPNVPTNEQRVIKVPSEFIDEVNLGMNISEQHKTEIITECTKRNIKVYQTEKTPFKFNLTRNII
ncbi:DUF2971 domain-containing protein [Lutibacter flavus]|uniref:DUF2971 domain-containing protein n=1 Tax=Lutibacter flavus TaxID=691689 RepID=A0A238VIN5_9FLAO|nr:DUF2971 domain-containing protein [Lutibacter flavus]SNR33977.1 Protein of unknown function [Lutibacter flavus]